MPLSADTILSFKRQAVEGHFLTQWGTTTAVQMVNVPEIDKVDDTGRAINWCWFRVEWGEERQESIGSSNPRFRANGLATCVLYVPRESGRDTINLLASKAARILRMTDLTVGSQTDCQITFDRHVDIGSEREEESWLQQAIRSRFTAQRRYT